LHPGRRPKARARMIVRIWEGFLMEYCFSGMKIGNPGDSPLALNPNIYSNITRNNIRELLKTMISRRMNK